MTAPSDISTGGSRLDALLPPEMARRAEEVGARKATMDTASTFTLAVLAGAFIALGGVFATTALAGAGTAPWGATRVLGGVAFSLGLVLVIVGGAELFTGNNLIVMAWASRRVTTSALLRNWLIVFIGNFVGASGTAVLPNRCRSRYQRTTSSISTRLKTVIFATKRRQWRDDTYMPKLTLSVDNGLSRIRYCGASSRPHASSSCRTVHSAVGCR